MDNSSSTKARAMGWLALPALLGVGAGAVLFWFNPAQNAFYPFCVFHRMTGLLCPGCGSLRALHQLLHGHLTVAFHCNALLVLALPPALGWVAYRASCQYRGVPGRNLVQPAQMWALLAVLIVFSILRNLPFPQLAFLAP